MQEMLALIVMLVALLVVVTCCAFAYACATVYVPPDWSPNRDDLLRRVLVEEFGAGRGLERTDWRDRRIAALLGAERPRVLDDDDDDVVVRAVLRFSRTGETAGDVDTVRWRARALGRSTLRQLESWARSCRHVDHMLLLWGVASRLAASRMWLAGVRRELVPAALRIGSRASSVAGTLGIAGVIVALFVYYGGRGARHDDAVRELLNLVGSWMAAGAVLGVLAVLGTQVRAVLRDLLDVWDVPRRRVWTALTMVSIVTVVAAGMQTFHWQDRLPHWQGELMSTASAAVPERWKVIGGLVLFAAFFALAGVRALRWSARAERPVPRRVLDAGSGLGLLIIVGAAVGIVVAPRSQVFVWAGSGLVGIGVIAVATWALTRVRDHRRRLRRLTERGITVSQGWYRWYALLGSAVAPFVLWPLIRGLDAVPYDVGTVVPRLTFALILVAGYVLSGPALLVQVVALIRYVRRVRRSAEDVLRPDGTPARDEATVRE